MAREKKPIPYIHSVERELFPGNYPYPDFDFSKVAVRIKRAELINFKSVRSGKILFGGKNPESSFDLADVMGIYGQNGSGKTSFIEALNIIKYLISGGAVPSAFSDCISIGSDSSKLRFFFLIKRNDGKITEVIYEVELGKDDSTIHPIYSVKDNDSDNELSYKSKAKVVILSESMYISGFYEGSEIKRQLIMRDELNSNFQLIKPLSKQHELFGRNKKQISELYDQKVSLMRNSQSFLFNPNLWSAIATSGKMTDASYIWGCLRVFSVLHLFVLSTKGSAYIRSNTAIPVYIRNTVLRFGEDFTQSGFLSNKVFEETKRIFSALSSVLSQIVPGLGLSFESDYSTRDEKGEIAHHVELLAERNGIKYPIRYESDGVRKLISELCMIATVYNDYSCTVAIDEFDAGVYEYLLGELLEIIETTGKGQFIFTSHNLRPLEVLNKEHLCFTSTNPDNRYIKKKYFKPSNNLRDVYYRDIIWGPTNQEEEMYSATKKSKIIAALKLAGDVIDAE